MIYAWPGFYYKTVPLYKISLLVQRNANGTFFWRCGGETWNEIQSNTELAKRPVIKQNNQCSVSL
jgi:hypothetical protein